MMTPRAVYSAIASYVGVKISKICDIKAHCVSFAYCSNKSQSSVLDFDGAAVAYQSELGMADVPPSVDAITVDKSASLLILIEKKTWGHFFKHLSDTDMLNPTTAALNKVKSYNLDAKYRSTRDICDHITNQKDLFLNLPHVFVFLTEFTDSDPVAGFAADLDRLAFTSSDIDYSIQSSVVQGMKEHLSTVSCRKSRYLNCMELDSYIDNPALFG